MASEFDADMYGKILACAFAGAFKVARNALGDGSSAPGDPGASHTKDDGFCDCTVVPTGLGVWRARNKDAALADTPAARPLCTARLYYISIGRGPPQPQ